MCYLDPVATMRARASRSASRWAALALAAAALTPGVACATRETGRSKTERRTMETATSYQWKDLWRGAGPATSPTGAPPGLTVAHTRKAWTRVIGAFGPPYDAHAELPVTWADEVILFVEGSEATPDAEVHLTSVRRSDGAVTIAATLRAGPAGQPSLGAEVRPWLIASAPAAALAGATKVELTLDGRALPVTQAR